MKKIKENEEFEMGGSVFSYHLEGGTIKLKRLRELFERSKKPEFVPPTLDQVKEFFASKGYSEQGAIKAWEHYEYGGWCDTHGTPVRAWKQKMNTNWLRDEFKLQEKQQPKMIR